MSTAQALRWSHAAIADQGQPAALPLWHVWAAALVVGFVFFVTEHNFSVSLADAYTQTADEMEITAGGGNAVRRVAFFIFAGLGIWLLAIGRQSLRFNLWLAAPIAMYAFVAGASYCWSVDPSMCLRRLIVAACCGLGALGVARRFSIREICLLTLAIIGPLVAGGLAAELRLGTFRPWAGDYRFSGSVHPNTQNMYLTALALAALGLARSPTRWRVALWALFAACMVLSVLTKSRTGNAATMLAIAAVFLVQTPWQQKLTWSFAGFWLALAGVWTLWVCGVHPLVDFRDIMLLGRAEESDTLSGRAFIWPLAWYFVKQRPWLGYGYESFWNPTNIDVVSEELQWGVRESHNGYLDVLLSTGAVGLICGLAAVTAALAAAARGSVRERNPAYALPLGMLVFGIATSAMESGMVGIMLPPVLTACCLVRMAFFENETERRKDRGTEGLLQ